MIFNSDDPGVSKLNNKLENLESDRFFNLLWENPTIEEFIPQTINLDLSEYDIILIWFNIPLTSNNSPDANMNYDRLVDHSVYMTLKGLRGTMNIVSRYGYDLYHRKVTCEDTGVIFEACKRVSLPSKTSVADNRIIIPTKIYGLKVKVG